MGTAACSVGHMTYEEGDIDPMQRPHAVWRSALGNPRREPRQLSGCTVGHHPEETARPLECVDRLHALYQP